MQHAELILASTSSGELFQAGVHLAKRTQNFGPFDPFWLFFCAFAHFWCTFTGLDNALLYQRQI